MIPILGALLGNPATMISVGSATLRAVGKMFGGKTEEVTEKVAGFVDEVRALPEKQAEATLTQRMAAMPPEELVELKKCEVELAKIHAQTVQKHLETQAKMHEIFQNRVIAEINSKDEIVRQTRPKMAKESFLLGSSYVLLVALSQFLASIFPGSATAMEFNPQIAAFAYSAAYGYLGLRTADGFTREGKSSGSSVAALKSLLPSMGGAVK